MNTVAIVDYGMCNLDSVARAVEECGGTPMVTAQPSDLERVARIVLPGVGAFADGMRHLHERGFVEPLKTAAERSVPLLGICLGMQLLADHGFEGAGADGLGLVPGTVKRFEPTAASERVPHVGWNSVNFHAASPLFAGIPQDGDFYFVHSYYFLPADESTTAAWTPYCGRFVSSVRRAMTFGVQFHPEKSQRLGFQVLRNFLAC